MTSTREFVLLAPASHIISSDFIKLHLLHALLISLFRSGRNVTVSHQQTGEGTCPSLVEVMAATSVTCGWEKNVAVGDSAMTTVSERMAARINLNFIIEHWNILNLWQTSTCYDSLVPLAQLDWQIKSSLVNFTWLESWYLTWLFMAPNYIVL